MTIELNKQTVAKIEYRWDDQDKNNPGWYAQALSESGEFLDDSQKIWFPVEVDQFDEEEEPDLVAALKLEFPEAEIAQA